MKPLAIALLLALSLPAHATLPQDSVVIYLKTAQVTLKRQYRITVPSPYITLIPCALPPASGGWTGICLDSIDNRLYTVQP